MERRDSGVKTFSRLFGVHGLPELVTVTVLAPLERYQILRQTRVFSSSSYSSLFNYLSSVPRTEGFSAYWKGNFASLFRLFISSIVRFRCYPLFRIAATETSETAIIGQEIWLSFAVLLAAYPLDLAHTRLAADVVSKPHGEPAYFGMSECLKTTLRTSGFKGLYQGFSVTFASLGPFIALGRWLDRERKKWVSEDWDVAAQTGCLLALQTLFYPFDTVRKRLQMNGSQGKSRLYTGARDCITKSIQEEGLSGVYGGVGVHLLRLVPYIWLIHYLSNLSL